MAPILCLITDRRRLARALDLPMAEAQSALIDQIIGAMKGGVDVVQMREPDLEAREYVGLVRAILSRRSDLRTRVIVNDRVDVAVAAGADGVHLRESSIVIAAARHLVGSRGWVGQSVHRGATPERYAGADYAIAGSVFETASKPGAPASLGLDGLREVVSAAGNCPVWAVGGITPERVGEVFGTGARGIAAIGGFIPGECPVDVAHAVEKLAKTWRFSFDRVAGLS